MYLCHLLVPYTIFVFVLLYVLGGIGIHFCISLTCVIIGVHTIILCDVFGITVRHGVASSWS